MKNSELLSIVLGNMKYFYKAKLIATESPEGIKAAPDGLLPNGPIKEYYSVLECVKTYKDGKIEGSLTISDVETNKVVIHEQYKDGKLINEQSAAAVKEITPAEVTFTRTAEERVFYIDGKETARQKLDEFGKITDTTGNTFTGTAKEFYTNGSLKKEAFFNKGFPEGEVKIYDSNGRLMSIEHYINGIKEGTETVFDFNNSILTEAKTNYRQGKIQGERQLFWKNGKLLATEFFVDNKRNGLRRTFFTNGNVSTSTMYKDNILDGERSFFYESGKMMYKENFVDGKLEGKRIGYYQNGNVFLEENYKNSILEGEKNIYDKEGTLVSREIYKDGKLIKPNKN